MSQAQVASGVMKREPKFFAVDFYCGAGGTTRGLIDAGGYVIAGVDRDVSCRTTYLRNNRNLTLTRNYPKFIGMDMLKPTLDYPGGQQHKVLEVLVDLISTYREQFPSVPLLFAICAPCQSFTKFIQRNMTDERDGERQRAASLLTETVALIERFEPEMVISENVTTIRGEKNQHVWDDFRSTLENVLDYVVDDREVCASKFGVAQRRRRLIMMAMKHRFGHSNSVKVPSADPSAPEKTARDAIYDLPRLGPGQKCAEKADHECRNLSEINLERLRSIGPGEPNFNFPDSLALPCHRRLSENGKPGFGDSYTRIHPGRPSPTITTRFHSISNGRFAHYAQNRGLSLREGARLQSFEDGYRFYSSSMDARAKMIGNAVPPVLSAYMARDLHEQWCQPKQLALGPQRNGRNVES